MKNKTKKTVVAVSDYFNPLHVGHLRLMQEAKELGDYLIVIINNDKQVKIKGSVPFMKEKDRVKIVEAIKWVDEAFLSIDTDSSVCKSLDKINPDIFANGGDRNKKNVPEDEVCKALKIKMADRTGGGKIRSSSTIIKKASKIEQK